MTHDRFTGNRAAQSVGSLVAFSLALSASAQTTWFVDQDASGPTHDGATWCSAFTDLQDALAVATAEDTIRVANGTYVPDRGVGQTLGDRVATLELTSLALEGGYAGCGAPDPDERDIDSYETFLSGDLLGDDGPDFENNEENSYHVVTAAGSNPNAIFDGFTVTGGNADGPGPHQMGGGMHSAGSSPTVRNCGFVGNWAVYGGGFLAAYGAATLIDCSFVNNAAANLGGGLESEFANPTLVNCVFVANTANDGGAVHTDFSSITLANCTISGNHAGNRGGGVYLYTGVTMTLTNSILWGNSAQLGTVESAQVYVTGGGNTPIINHSCIEDWTGQYGGVGNLGDDPLFVNSAASDFHLRPDSPSVDAGSNEALPDDIITDLDGKPRFIDGDDDGDVDVDMGAYEFQGGAICPADLDGDDTIGASDLAILLGAWGPCPDCPADLDGDGAVGPFDLALLLGNWGSCPG